MTCETFSMDMYTQRAGEDRPMSREFADHLRSCDACSQRFARIVEQDAAILRTIGLVAPPAELERSILSGLAVERASHGIRAQRVRWLRWMLVPITIVLAMAAFLLHARWQARAVIDQAAILLQSSPPLGVKGGGRNQILHWSAQIEPGVDALPDRLARLDFLGASAVKVNDHAAVLLRMEHEPRASLLIVNAPLIGSSEIASRSADAGSMAYWTEHRKTYVLLFRGNLQQLQGYMQTMGITA